MNLKGTIVLKFAGHRVFNLRKSVANSNLPREKFVRADLERPLFSTCSRPKNPVSTKLKLLAYLSFAHDILTII